MKIFSPLVIGILAVVTLGPAFANEQARLWYLDKDTGEIDAIVIAVTGPDLPHTEILVREGEYGTIRFTRGGPILGLKASHIGLRGESASVDVFWMDHLMSEKARASQFVERLELGKDGAVKLPADAARRAGRGLIDIQLVGAKLANR
ncbi:MAG: hypothetical protein AAF604_09265 [Acidobacteriota bacterium]